MSKAKILLLDIETAPILGYFWALWDQNIGLNQIKQDTHILSWSAKWLDSKEIFYADQSKAKNFENEKEMLKGLWKLLDEADVVLGHNSKRFDIKRINARFIIHGMQPPSSYRQIDTLQIAKKHFSFTSNKLEHLAKILKCENKKLTARKFNGFVLWTECLARNKEAWAEMQKYNKQDVIVLEEVYKKLMPWDSTINFNVYNDKEETTCTCGSTSFLKRGFVYSNAAKYQRFRCNKCGKEFKSKENLLTPEKRKSLRK